MGNERDISAVKSSFRDKLMAIILLETSKDYREMDSDLVTECVDFLMELEGKQRITRKEIEQRVSEIPFKGKVTALSSYAKRKLRAKRLAIAAAVLAGIIALMGILAVASGNTFREFFRKMGTSIYELLDGSSMEFDGITFIKPGETVEYDSVEELLESEKIEILYPSWLPENEKIIKVYCLNEDGSDKYMLQSNSPYIGVNIELGTALPDDIRMECVPQEISGYSVYIKETELLFQATFAYKNNLYIVKSDTEDNLFKTIENLKEIN